MRAVKPTAVSAATTYEAPRTQAGGLGGGGRGGGDGGRGGEGEGGGEGDSKRS